MTNRSKHFKGSSTFAQWVYEQRAINGNVGSYNGDDLTVATEGLTALIRGDTRNLKHAQELISQLSPLVEVPRRTLRMDVAGFFPNVPAYLAQVPTNMYNMHKEPSDRSPLRVFVGLSSSAGISELELVKRGAALSAFAMAMSNVRPVFITPYVLLASFDDYSRGYRRSRYSHQDKTRNMLISWDISTSPLVLSELLAVTLPSVTRHVGIESCRHLFGKEARGDGSWHQDSKNEQAMRQHLGAGPDDLYLPSIHLYDEILNDPVLWVNTQVKRFTEGEETKFGG